MPYSSRLLPLTIQTISTLLFRRQYVVLASSLLENYPPDYAMEMIELEQEAFNSYQFDISTPTRSRKALAQGLASTVFLDEMLSR